MKPSSDLHHYYPKARLQYFRYPQDDRVPPEMFDVQVLKMLQRYGMSAHFRGKELQKLEGIPDQGEETIQVAVDAVRHVQPFLVTLLN